MRRQDPDLHLSKGWIRIRIKVKGWIWIRMKVNTLDLDPH
jgi:hypothetical protein